MRKSCENGFFLIDQVSWESEERFRTQAMRYVAALLTNLGGQLDVVALRAVKPEEFFHVNLRPYCNMGFKDDVEGDRKGGWTDQGAQDMRNLPVGKQVWGGIHFDIIDPAANDGKSCIVIRGGQRPYFPQGRRGIRVERKVRELSFLHTCAWAEAEGTLVAKYVVHYDDGSKVELPLKVNVHLADWFANVGELPMAEVAWRGTTYSVEEKKQHPILLHSMRRVNPYPDKTIAALDFVSANAPAVPVLIAVSGRGG